MINYFKKYFFLSLVFASFSASAAENSLTGNIEAVTSTASGLLIRLDTGVPDNCKGVAYDLMIINSENSVMIAAALTGWANEKKQVTVYTDPISSGRCNINQFDPHW
ncbi:MAG: hypothetical protein K0U59_03260 [Gammaproteobacteria bacterium]|nr:hypothetical protein [Gammaproteobacteria bacterium]